MPRGIPRRLQSSPPPTPGEWEPPQRLKAGFSADQVEQLEFLFSRNRSLWSVSQAERAELKEELGLSIERLRSWWIQRQKKQHLAKKSKGSFIEKKRRGRARGVESEKVESEEVESEEEDVKPDLKRSGSPIQTDGEKRPRMKQERTMLGFHEDEEEKQKRGLRREMRAKRRDELLGGVKVEPGLSCSPPPSTPFQEDCPPRSSPLSLVSYPVPTALLDPTSPPPPPIHVPSLVEPDLVPSPEREPASKGKELSTTPEWFDLLFNEREIEVMKRKIDNNFGSWEREDAKENVALLAVSATIKLLESEGGEEIEDALRIDCTRLTMGSWFCSSSRDQEPSFHLDYHPASQTFAFYFYCDSSHHRILLPLSSLSSIRILSDPRTDLGYLFFFHPLHQQVTYQSYNNYLSGWDTVTCDFTPNLSATRNSIWYIDLPHARKTIDTIYTMARLHGKGGIVLNMVWWGTFNSSVFDGGDLAYGFGRPLTVSRGVDGEEGEERWNPLKGRMVKVVEYRNIEGGLTWLRNLGFEEREKAKQVQKEEGTPSPMKRSVGFGVDSTLATYETKGLEDPMSDSIDPAYLTIQSSTPPLFYSDSDTSETPTPSPTTPPHDDLGPREITGLESGYNHESARTVYGVKEYTPNNCGKGNDGGGDLQWLMDKYHPGGSGY